MNSLVSYGSNSDSSDDEGVDNCIVGHLVSAEPKEAAKNPTEENLLTTEDDFDAVVVESAESNKDGSGLFGELPAMSGTVSAAAAKKSSSTEDQLEEFVTEMKPWEKKLREAAEAKKQKRLAKEQKKKKKKGKVQIAAFAAKTTSRADDEDDDEEVEERKPSVLDEARAVDKPSGLLSMLPPPKSDSKGKVLDIFAKMAPRNVAKPKKVAPVVEPTPVVVADDSESDDDGPSDFFGLSSSEPKRSKFEEMSSAAGPSGFKINVQPTQHRGTYGPAKPTAEDEIEAEQPGAREPSKRDLSDEKAFNLIYKHEMQPWGFSDRKAAEALDKIVDVDMNQRLVDVRASLLRNMNSTQTAEVAATVTSRNSGQKAKPSRDINSKRKHQITYLADLAVSRDEQLREQWSNNRQAKIQSKNKYGF